MWKFLSPFTCRTMRDFSSRSVGRGQCHWGGGSGSPPDGWWVLTVADDPSQGLPLEVELDVHVLALGEGAGSGKGVLVGLAAPLPTSPSLCSQPHQSPQGPTALPRSLTNREELSLRTVLAFPKAAGEDGGYGVVQGDGAAPWQVWDVRGGAQGVGTHPPAQGWTAGAAPSPCSPPPLCCSRLPRRTSPACWPLPERGRGSLLWGCGLWGCPPHPTSPSQCLEPPLQPWLYPSCQRRSRR